jgi:23S rRNA (guanosine2251-2'-O)-methyltransferase
VIGTSDQAARSLFECDLRRPFVLVMGREDRGLRKGMQDRFDDLVSLPMHGEVASLNVSVATAVCLYEAVRQRRHGSAP